MKIAIFTTSLVVFFTCKRINNKEGESYFYTKKETEYCEETNGIYAINMQKRSYFLALLWIVLEKIAKVLLAFMNKKRSKRKEISKSFY